MKSWVASYEVWVGWLVLFLILEFTPKVWAGCPWAQLSDTSWHAERSYPIVRALLLGFLVGLAVHIVYRVPMWQAQLFGLGFSLLTHFVHFRSKV